MRPLLPESWSLGSRFDPSKFCVIAGVIVPHCWAGELDNFDDLIVGSLRRHASKWGAYAVDLTRVGIEPAPMGLAPLGWGHDAVYVVEDTESGLVKIGRTKKHPLERMRQLQRGSSATLALLHWWSAPRQAEWGLHATHAQHHVGGEWFDFGRDTLRAMLAINANDLPRARGPLGA